VTAHDTHLSLAVDRRTYTPAEDPFLVDVADLILQHRRNGTECGPNCTTWTTGTYEEHLTNELAGAGYLRDEQTAQAAAIATGRRHPFHP
jgi:hypothetical protein